MEIVIPILIYLGVPLIGLFIFLLLFRNVEDQAIYIISFINTAHLGGWLLIVLTILFWSISGMLILGYFYLVFISPILSIGFLCYLLINKSTLTNYRYALSTSIINLCITLFMFFMFIVNIFKDKAITR